MMDSRSFHLEVISRFLWKSRFSTFITRWFVLAKSHITCIFFMLLILYSVKNKQHKMSWLSFDLTLWQNNHDNNKSL